MNRFGQTQSLIADIEDILHENKIDQASPIINYHLIKVGILSFSGEIENDLKELISKKIGGYKHFCRLCNKLRNPKIADINDVLNELSIAKLEIEDSKKSKFSNIIVARDKVAHTPDFNSNISLNDLKEGVQIGNEILDHIEQHV